MKLSNKIAFLTTAMLLSSTMLCGFYIRYSGAVITEGDLNFHMGLGISAGVFTLITLATFVRPTQKTVNYGKIKEEKQHKTTNRKKEVNESEF